jgi:D-aminoacyl-tRNA deacylase
MRVLITSEHDPASLNMKQILIDEYGFESTQEIFENNVIYEDSNGNKLITTREDMIHCSHLSRTFDPEIFIFCSRHRSQSGTPALLVHSTGNFGEDTSYGGNAFSLSISAPSIVRQALLSLEREKQLRNLHEFDVTLEVTHHGPTELTRPVVFIELGSNEDYWNHKEGGRAVVAAITDCLTTSLECSSVIGFGGTHYASKFNKLVLERGVSIGHIAPKYALDNVNESVVRQMIERSSGHVEKAVIDWKGTNASQKELLFTILDELGLDVIKARDVEKTKTP